MNKYIYRIIFASFLLLCFVDLPLAGGLLRVAGLALLPFLLIFYFFVGSITGQPSNPFGDISPLNSLIVNVSISAAVLFLLYWFLRAWLAAELRAKPDELKAKATKVYTYAYLCLAALALISLVGFSVPAVKKYSTGMAMVPVDAGALKIENYEETPFYEWGSRVPVGVTLEFDLVGEGQQNLVVNHFLNGTGEYRPTCFTNDPAMEEAKRRSPGTFNYLNSYLLQNTSRNRIKYKCYSPVFAKMVAGHYYYMCPSDDTDRLSVTMEPSEVYMKLEGQSREAVSKDISAVIRRGIPRNSHLYDTAFWMNADAQYDKITLPAGHSICTHTYPFYDKQISQRCICREKETKGQ